MTEIIGQQLWSKVRLLETDEYATAGPNGNMNEQAKALTDRTEFLKAEKVGFQDIVQGQYSFETLQKFNTLKSTIPVNSTVIIDESGPNQGTNIWDGTTLKKSSYDPVSTILNYLNSQAIFKPKLISQAIDFNNFREFGLHYFASGTVWDNSTNKPLNINNQWAFVLVIPISSAVCGQFIWCFNSQKLTYRYSNSSSIWSPQWQIFSDDSTLTTKIESSINLDRDTSFESRLNNILTPVFDNLSKNIFDKSIQLLSNSRLNTNGVVEMNTNSFVSQLINIKGLTSLAISGLQASVGAYRAYRFLDSSKVKISVSSIAPGATGGIIPVPANAVWFQITLKDGSDSWVLDLNTIQIENGTSTTSYAPYSRGKLKSLLGADIFIEVDAAQVKDILNPIFSSKTKNIFDRDSLIKDYRIITTGELQYNLNSITTRLINVKGIASLAVSGLQASAGAYRAFRFLDSNKVKISVSSIAPGATGGIISVPANAVWLQITLKDGSDSWVLDPSSIQIEAGTQVTAYTPFVRGNLLSLYDSDVIGSGTGSSSNAFGARYLIFGDSITETSNVEAGVYDQTSNWTQWPTYAFAQLKMSRFRNYAKSGASFRNRNLSSQYQFLGYQIEKAIANNEVTDVVIVSCGTNDGTSSLGNYETAMSKSTKADLDKTLLFESARYAFWSIREKWPDAICFYCVPLQRASADSTELAPMLDGLTKMAKRYGFTIIDQHTESGIIRDFESVGTEGKYLADGLHPNASGKILQAKYICGKIISRMAM
ncbi:GDSL-type esterase/lipase family protein [Acinetobacter modestus]|uniref:GDSL-type esterase/lipase family protein n=1 Tax=Acinetobacter modestus TaxID=1776740 RepID=UPI001F4B7FE0|nr:GDSL-type esterase/lipase family protein [Acinetobacter modestus]MCH7387670.1 GDSL-type esterase/lipase family protein [Acinetobacter modestus]